MSLRVQCRGYQVVSPDSSPIVRSSCGESERVITWQESDVSSIHVTRIRDSRPHYHRLSTETYYILEGSGTMELAGESFSLTPGTTILIEPGTVHRAYGDFRTVVFGVPPWRPDDEYYPEEAVMDDADSARNST